MTDTDPDDTFVVAGEPLEPVDGRADIGIRPVDNESFPDAHIAVHRPTGTAAWGATRDDAIENVNRGVPHLEDPDRTGEIVETPGVLGGDPRVAGSRIGVLHVVTAYEDTDSVVETAAGFSGPLTVDEALAALEWAEAHAAELQRLRDERARTIERIRSDWERLEVPDGADGATYRRPGSNTFALLGPDEEEP